MDLTDTDTFRTATTRADLALAPGEHLLGGGTWLFSTPQPGVTGLVDLTTLDWSAVEDLADGSLRIAGTCTVATLVAALADDVHLGALVRSAAEAFLMSHKIQHTATVGGNLALALPAGAMISLTAALDATVVIWCPDGSTRTEPVRTFVHGVERTSLAPGEVIRAVDVPAASRTSRCVFRRTSLATYGRSSAVVIGRLTPAGPELTLTASTTRPVVVGDAAELAGVDCWYADPHGPADWRAAMTLRLAREVTEELVA